MRYLLIGAASIALAASGATAEPGKGKDQGGNHHGGGAHAAVKANGNAGRDGPGARVEARGNANVRAEKRNEDRRDMSERRAERRDDERGNRGDDKRWERGDRDDDRRYVERDGRGDRDDDVRVVSRSRGDVRYVDRDVFYRDRAVFREDSRRSYLDGCPPGLAKKDNGCLPPGQAKKYDDRRYFNYDYQPRLFGLRSYDRGNYFYRDGYLIRLGSNNLVSGYIPLLGGALAIGNPWPTNYRSYDLPAYYVDYYDLGSADNYRFADNVVYRVDAEDAAIQSIAALLTGDDFAIGQPMPVGYDVYNVPYAYRDRYYDTPDAMYRYSDGYVYRIDPKTQLIAAAIDLLV